jgi:hypothetical protein
MSNCSKRYTPPPQPLPMSRFSLANVAIAALLTLGFAKWLGVLAVPLDFGRISLLCCLALALR